MTVNLGIRKIWTTIVRRIGLRTLRRIAIRLFAEHGILQHKSREIIFPEDDMDIAHVQ